MTEFEITGAIRTGESLHLVGFGMAVRPLEIEADAWAGAYAVLVQVPNGDEVWSVSSDDLAPLVTEDC